MTKKDYIKFAAVLADQKPDAADLQSDAYQAQRDQWMQTTEAIADIFASENGRFDRERFYRACGL
jgi:hypothetical protein